MRRGFAIFLTALALLGPGAGAAHAGAGALTVGAPMALPQPTSLTSIACVDADTCYSTGGWPGGPGPKFLITLTDGSQTDEQTIPGASTVSGIACAPGGACYVIGLTSRPPEGSVFPITAGSPGPAQLIDGVSLDGIACAPDGACYAVGATEPSLEGVVVPLVAGQAGQPQPVPGTSNLSDIDCPTADTCYAIGMSADGLPGGPIAVVVPVVDGLPGAAQPIDGGDFRAIACPSADTCYAAGYAGGLASANEGQGTGGIVTIVDGQPAAVQAVPAAGPLDAIACPTASTCLALGLVHNPLSAGATQRAGFPTPDAAIVPITAGQPGDVIDVSTASSPLLGGYCPISSTCYVFTQDQIISVNLGGG